MMILPTPNPLLRLPLFPGPLSFVRRLHRFSTHQLYTASPVLSRPQADYTGVSQRKSICRIDLRLQQKILRISVFAVGHTRKQDNARGGLPSRLAAMAFPRDFGGGLVPGPVDSTPGMRIDEPAGPIRMVAPPMRSLPVRVRNLGPGSRSRPVRTDLTTGPGGLHYRGITCRDLGSAAVLPDEGREPAGAVPRPGLSQAAPGPAGREPTGTAPPVGGRARAGTAAGTDERSGRVGRV